MQIETLAAFSGNAGLFFWLSLVLLSLSAAALFWWRGHHVRVLLARAERECERLRRENTDRQEQEAERTAQAEARAVGFEMTLRHLPVPVWRFDTDGKVVWGNGAFMRLSGNGDPGKTGLPVRAGDGPARRPLHDDADAGDAQTVSRTIRVGDHTRIFRVTETPFPGGETGGESGEKPAGKAGGGCGIGIDITDAEIIRDDLRRHVDALNNAFQPLNTAIAVYGPDQRLLIFNQAFARLSHIPERWLKAQPEIIDVLQRMREQKRFPEQSDWKACFASYQKMFRTVIEPREEMLHLPDGQDIRVIIARHPLGGLLFAHEDVTGQLKLERTLRTQLEVQRTTLDNLFEGTASFAGDGRLALWNPAFERMFGLSGRNLGQKPHINEVLDTIATRFAGQPEWPETRERILSHYHSRREVSGRIENNGGKVIEYSLHPVPDGTVLFIFWDSTESYRFQQALVERNEALREADTVKAHFIANVSHSLRTPMTAAVGFAEMLANEACGELNPRQREYARDILGACQELLALVDRIIELANLDAGRVSVDLSLFDIHAALAEVMTLVRPQAQAGGVRLEFDGSPAIGDMRADRRHLQRILVNLLGNSLKFAGRGGMVRLSVQRNDDGAVVFVVEDDGPGIAPADMAHVFDAFSRGSHGMKHEGVGLGLTLAGKYTEIHGARLSLSPREGGGTVARLEFPAPALLPNSAESPEEPRRDG